MLRGALLAGEREIKKGICRISGDNSDEGQGFTRGGLLLLLGRRGVSCYGIVSSLLSMSTLCFFAKPSSTKCALRCACLHTCMACKHLAHNIISKDLPGWVRLQLNLKAGRLDRSSCTLFSWRRNLCLARATKKLCVSFAKWFVYMR